MARAAVSQETCPGWSKLALFARRSVAMSLAILARLFCFGGNLHLARVSKRARMAIVADAWSSEHRQECPVPLFARLFSGWFWAMGSRRGSRGWIVLCAAICCGFSTMLDSATRAAELRQ